jgi:hypothetical protein
VNTYSIGARLRSQVCQTEVIVVRAPAGTGELSCGGAPMAELDAQPDAGVQLDPDKATGALLGKRYVHPAIEGLEVLVTRGGQGSLAFAGQVLQVKEATPLPASD